MQDCAGTNDEDVVGRIEGRQTGPLESNGVDIWSNAETECDGKSVASREGRARVVVSRRYGSRWRQSELSREKKSKER